MPEYVTLLGAESVQQAGHHISQAAQEFNRSVGYLSEVLAQHQRFMDDWLEQFRVLLALVPAPAAGGEG